MFQPRDPSSESLSPDGEKNAGLKPETSSGRASGSRLRRAVGIGLVGALLGLGGALPLRALNYLFFLELQGVAGYSTAARKVIAYSMDPFETMQKPGLGIDYVQRFSGRAGDFAVLSLQGRLVWNAEGEKTFEPQLYNAFLKFKTRPFDIWVGHDRPKFGLSSIVDNHASLLQFLNMMGFGFDRDWGVGIEKDTSRGQFGLSLTTGSGMALKMKGNYFLSGRLGFGVLNEDNITAGLSLGYGKLRDVAGYEALSDNLIDFAMAALDVTWLKDNFENRIELMGGKRAGLATLAAVWRFGVGFLEENRLKLEFQPTAILTTESKRFEFAGGLTFLAHPDWTLRTMVSYDFHMQDTRVVFQIYFYKGIRF
jgi:hypothetical protein